MALITTYEHFVKYPIFVPNAIPSDGNTDATVLQNHISKFEPEYLKAIFGQELYDLFIDGIDNLTSKYLTLRDGGTYTDVFGITQKWEGFVSGNNPIANYIYCKHLRSVNPTFTSAGVQAQNIANGEKMNPSSMLVAAWNDMVKMNWQLHGYLYANQSLFSEYIGLNYPPDTHLYSTFPDNLPLFVKINQFGI